MRILSGSLFEPNVWTRSMQKFDHFQSEKKGIYDNIRVAK